MKRHTFNGWPTADYSAVSELHVLVGFVRRRWLCAVCGLQVGSKLHRRLR